MGRRWATVLLAAAAGGDDDRRRPLARRAAAIRAARGERGAAAPPVVLRALAPLYAPSDAFDGDAFDGAATAGAAGVTVPIAIDGADARLRAEPGERLIVAAQRFAEAHLSRYEGGGCGIGDRSCVVDKLYEALREEDSQLRLKAAAKEAERHKLVGAGLLVLVVLGVLVARHLKRKAATHLSKSLAVNASRAEKRSREAMAAEAAVLQATHDRRIREIRAKVTTTSTVDDEEVVRLKRANESLRKRLADKEPVSVSLASARKHLQKAAELLLTGAGNALVNEKEIERWDKVIQNHPQQIEESEKARLAWLGEHAEARDSARRFIRSLVPPSVWKGVKLVDLEAAGLSKACAKRVFATPALWLCRAEPGRVSKFHVADLRGRYAYDRLTLLELRAVYVSLPAFTDTAKAQWKQSLEDKLRAYETGNLPPAKRAPLCFDADGPFDPEADDAVAAPAAREEAPAVEAVAAPPAFLAAIRAGSDNAAPAPGPTGAPAGGNLMSSIRSRSDATRPTAPGNALMEAIQARSDASRPLAAAPGDAPGGALLAAIQSRRPRAAAPGNDLMAAIKSRRSRTPPRSRKKPAKVVVPARPGDLLAAVRARKPLKPQDENAARTPPRKNAPRKPGPPGRSPRSAFCAVINTRAAQDKVPAAGCI